MDCSPPGSVHGISQERKPKWVAISFSRGSSWSRDQKCFSRITGRFFYHWATREAQQDVRKDLEKTVVRFRLCDLQKNSRMWGFLWTWFSQEAEAILRLNILILFSCSVQSSHSVVSDSLGTHEPQNVRLPCPWPTPAVYSNSCPLSQWCHPTISSSVVPFSFHSQSLPASESFPMSQFFASGG